MNLLDFREIIDSKPIHIATATPEGDPNLAVASDVNILGDKKLIISVNEMNHTQNNITHNPKVVITAFDGNWSGVRILGKARFYENGEYRDYCKEKFFGNGEISPFGATEPKGAIVVEVDRVEEYK